MRGMRDREGGEIIGYINFGIKKEVGN